MILSTKERLVLSMIMEPQAGRFDALKLIRKFREDLSFSQDEIKEINLRQEDAGNFRWDKELTKDVDIGEITMGIIKKQFQKLDREERLQEDHLDLFMKFTQGESAS